MPWINLTLRRGALSKNAQHKMMSTLTEVLMWWEKVPDTPKARSIMKGWVYEVDEDSDYSAGRPDHEKPFYFLEIRIPIRRLDVLAKSGLIRDFTRVVLETEGAENTPDNARRVWVTIMEIERDDWGVGGHTDWLRDYTVRSTKFTARSPAISAFEAAREITAMLEFGNVRKIKWQNNNRGLPPMRRC